MPTAPTSEALTPLEQLIWDVFRQDPILMEVYGPYFYWEVDPQGVPYCLCVDAGGSPNLYTIPQIPTIPTTRQARDVITQPRMQFSFFSLDAARLVDPHAGVLNAFQRAFEGVANRRMKDGSVCLSSLMPLPWVKRWEPRAKLTPGGGPQANIYHGQGYVNFQIERPVGRI